METVPPGVDVNPITQQLRQRLQQRSILYLMGPQRMLDRLRQAPGLLARMPRVAWDYVRTGEVSVNAFAPVTGGKPEQPPDFRAILSDQFAVVQSRIDDVLRASPLASAWIADPIEGAGYTTERFDPSDAGKIADEEITDLRGWLDKRWDATPRDTRIVLALLKHLPGGAKLTRLTEAAPYLLTLAMVVHHALFGMDLLVLGGYSLATWLTEKLSNEVSGRTRSTNQRIVSPASPTSRFSAPAAGWMTVPLRSRQSRNWKRWPRNARQAPETSDGGAGGVKSSLPTPKPNG
jgi:hypothetical protein